MSYLLDGKRIVMGTCYYPEHWDRGLWREDLRRMKEAGIEVIRIAEFAWNKTEIREGVFDFGFFDGFLDLCEEEDMKVIFCTPTATPPAWMSEKYPEILNADRDGVLYRHGMRRHYNYNSPVYRGFSRRITEKLAQHYAARSCIIGWQLDNELNCETEWFYSESDTAAFREFLRNKYGSADALNEAWGTVFWNQTYLDFSEIHVPRKTIHDAPNPHLMLDYMRFISESARSFAKEQADILRRYLKPGDFITTNGIFANLDYKALTEESLDFLCYDSYPDFAYTMDSDQSDPDSLLDRQWSRNLTEVRASSPAFGIMEQQSGGNGWTTRMEAPTPRPGQLRLWTMQSVAHGADFVSYFRWRTATMGTEIYWHGILDYSGRENRRIREVRGVAQDFAKLSPVAGALYKADAAVLKDYDNVFDASMDVFHKRVETQSAQALFCAAQKTHTPLDYLYLDHARLSDLLRYKVLFYPHAVILTPSRTELLKAYVQAGGILVFACRTGYKDLTGKCVTEKLPGLAAALSGTDVTEYSFIGPDADPVFVNWDGTRFPAAVFADLLSPLPNGRMEGTYEGEYFSGEGALVSSETGSGKVYYYGSAFSEQAARVFLEKLGAADPLRDTLTLPQEVELAVREKDGKRYAFLLNYAKHEAELVFRRPCRDLLSGELLSGKTVLPAFGVFVAEL